jgi:FkbH-like protein
MNTPSPGPTRANGAPTPAVDPALFARHNGSRYRVPIDLQVTPDRPWRFLVIGACLAEAFPPVAALLNPAFRGDFHLLNNFDSFPDIPPELAADYDFQIVHIPLPSVLGNTFFRLPVDGSQHEEFLRETQERLARYLANAARLNSERKLLTFVLGFLVPQQNPLGRFQPRYDLRNLVHFIERLNAFLAAEVARRENAHFIDIDQISAGIGKKACQDDMVWSFAHGTTLSDGDHDHDLARLEPPAPMQQHYTARWLEFFEAVLLEIFAMCRALEQQDSVKLVAVDLDDTLWRGVAAETTLGTLDGWPTGLMEALLVLKQRGILLAIVSKNDERFIVERFTQIVQGQMALADFAVWKINFRSKVENLAEILADLNLRPQNAVMIDDNPVERAAIEAGLPGVRVLGRHPYYLKRILLWSPETQRSVITREAREKTEMVRGQLERESVRRQLPHDEFLATLRVRVSVSTIRASGDLQLSRALELFNKTNQFNTTGTRYTFEQCHQMLAAGLRLFVVQAEDRFTQYGLIAAAWVRDNCVDHLVMSCRALGLGIEEAFLAHLADQLAREGANVLLGRLVPTEANLACRPLYSRNGFEPAPGNATLWSRSLAVPFPYPGHVQFREGRAAA